MVGQGRTATHLTKRSTEEKTVHKAEIKNGLRGSRKPREKGLLQRGQLSILLYRVAWGEGGQPQNKKISKVPSSQTEQREVALADLVSVDQTRIQRRENGKVKTVSLSRQEGKGKGRKKKGGFVHHPGRKKFAHREARGLHEQTEHDWLECHPPGGGSANSCAVHAEGVKAGTEFQEGCSLRSNPVGVGWARSENPGKRSSGGERRRGDKVQ